MTTNKSLWSRLVPAWLFTAVCDGLFSSVLVMFFYGSTFAKLWQGVAATVMGPSAVDGGTTPILVGILMHFGVALAWTIVLITLVTQSPWLRSVIQSPMGALKVAVVYGPIIWCVMSFGVIQLLTHKPPTITPRWWIQFFGHIPFVALPMAYVIGRREPS